MSSLFLDFPDFVFKSEDYGLRVDQDCESVYSSSSAGSTGLSSNMENAMENIVSSSLDDFVDHLTCSPQLPTDLSSNQQSQNDVTKNATPGDSSAISNLPKNESKSSDEKPTKSFVNLIALAILNSPDQRLILGDIYQYVMDNFPYYNNSSRTWRNSIRHNLSLNNCFVKLGRAESGKGNYWAIHPNCYEDFKKGDFRKRNNRPRIRRKPSVVHVSHLSNEQKQLMGFVAMSDYQQRSHRFQPYSMPNQMTQVADKLKGHIVQFPVQPQMNQRFMQPQQHLGIQYLPHPMPQQQPKYHPLLCPPESLMLPPPPSNQMQNVSHHYRPGHQQPQRISGRISPSSLSNSSCSSAPDLYSNPSPPPLSHFQRRNSYPFTPSAMPSKDAMGQFQPEDFKTLDFSNINFFGTPTPISTPSNRSSLGSPIDLTISPPSNYGRSSYTSSPASDNGLGYQSVTMTG